MVPLAVTSPSETDPGLAIVTLPAVATNETAPDRFSTSVAWSASKLKVPAVAFNDPAWILAPTTSVIEPELVTAKLPGVWILASEVLASSKSVMLVPLAVMSPSETDPGLAIVTLPVVATSETAPDRFNTSVVLSASKINVPAFAFNVPAWMLAPAMSVIAPELVTTKLPGV